MAFGQFVKCFHACSNNVLNKISLGFRARLFLFDVLEHPAHEMCGLVGESPRHLDDAGLLAKADEEYASLPAHELLTVARVGSGERRMILGRPAALVPHELLVGSLVVDHEQRGRPLPEIDLVNSLHA